ncbi:hypothetical protein K435DRAFT_903467, partial [Dendrothele bispora CBS 962.96]
RHPGGSSIILKYARCDATAAYEPIHPADALKKHSHPSCHLGYVDHNSSIQREGTVKDTRRVVGRGSVEEVTAVGEDVEFERFGECSKTSSSSQNPLLLLIWCRQ